MKNNFIILIILIGITFSFSSCNAVKYVPENESLLTKNTIFVNDKKVIIDEINDYVLQRPNQLVLGVPLSLYFYNIGNINFSEDFDQWKRNYPKKFNFRSALFSEKQAKALWKFGYGVNQWWFKNGDAPVIFDVKKANQTAANLTQHYFNEGYFNAKVTFQEKRRKNQKIGINYKVQTGKLYMLDGINSAIKSVVIDSIHDIHKSGSHLKKGQPFKLSSFIAEQDRLTNIFKNSGVFRFNKNAITFEVDSLDYKANITLNISDSIGNNTFNVQKIRNINIYTDYRYINKDNPIIDSLTYEGYKFLAYNKLDYNPKQLLNSVFLKTGEIYKDETRDLTRRHLRGLKNFRTVDIQFTELENDELDASIYLTPLKKYAIGFNTELTHSNIRQLGTLAKISFLNRNSFKGAEILKFSIQGSFINSKDAADNDRLLNAWEIGGDISLEVPRLLIPSLTHKVSVKSMSPKTTFTLGTSLQKNIGLDKQKFTGIMDYTWEASRRINHSFQLFNTQFINNLNIEQYFYIYRFEYSELEIIQDQYFPDYPLTEDNAIEFIDENIDLQFKQTNPDDYEIAKNIESRYYIITENSIIPTIAYTLTFNNSENYKDSNFSFFRARFISAGNITAALAKPNDSTQVKTLFNTPIAQYFRTDLEYKKFWDLSMENILAFRTFIGIAVPYGNSREIPFSRSYFIGGSNDLRAWKIYDLGPGSVKSGLEYNVANFKILTTLEYRFKIINSIKGTLFADAGNIWDISNSPLTPPGGKFVGWKSFKDIALGTGFGIRYDLSFILLRLDLGFKTYEPYIKNGRKWFEHYNFGNAVYNFGISYPF